MHEYKQFATIACKESRTAGLQVTSRLALPSTVGLIHEYVTGKTLVRKGEKQRDFTDYAAQCNPP